MCAGVFKVIHVMALGVLVLSGIITPAPVRAQLACIEISKVAFLDVTLFSAVQQQGWAAPFEDRCLGVQEFDEVLQGVTSTYVDAGFILSRAYLPEQDLSDATLDITVVEGSLSEILINGEVRSNWSNRVFPGILGKPLNLRIVEQGLDTIQEMPRWQAEMEFDAGEEAGESRLLITAQSAKPRQIKFTSNNRGNAGSGLWLSGLEYDDTNLFGINDTLTVGLSKSVTSNPFNLVYSGDSNRSASFGFSFPHGKWLFDVGVSWSDYVLTIPGVISPIVTNGNTHGQTFKAKYLLNRDQSAKSHLSFDLKRSANNNYIAGVRIEGSSRRLTSLRVTYDKKHPQWGGQLAWAVFGEAGLKLFGAEDYGDQPSGAPNAQYALIGANATFGRKVAVFGQTMDLSSTLSGQWSSHRLYGGQQYSIGGVSTVRGSRSALATGSSGFLWRNELAFGPQVKADKIFGRPEFYGALDLGRVFKSSRLSVSGGTAFGGALGLRLKEGSFTFDASYQRLLKVSSGLQKPDGELFLEFSYAF